MDTATVNITIQEDTDGDGIPNVTDPDDDNDGNPDATDPNPLNPTTADDMLTAMPGTPTSLDILANDDFLPGNDTTITDLGSGNANGTIVFDPITGELTYTPVSGEEGTVVTVDYQVCNTAVTPNVCDTATAIITVNPGVIDTDGDTIPDAIDLDDDNDGIPDTVELGGDPNLDTDGDMIIDSLDPDSDGDGITDLSESGNDGSDANNDGQLDGPFGTDGIADDIQDTPNGGDINYIPMDTDGDGTPDFQDIDDDGDSINTINESPDPNGDGNPDDAIDTDNDGTPDFLEENNADPNAEDGVEVFNALTPNGDGDHDTFVIRNIENFPENELYIYNRWGVLVFEAEGYGTNGELFNGTSNGRVTISKTKELPVGTYFYILTYKNENGELKKRSDYLYINR